MAVHCCKLFGIYILVLGLSVVAKAKLSYIGCFIDDEDRMYNFPSVEHGLIHSSMTVNYCAQYCKSNSNRYVYSAVQNAQSCFCSNEIPGQYQYRKVNDSECSKPCVGDASQICGDGWRNSVYKDCSALPPIPYPCNKFDCETPSKKWCTGCSDKTYYKLINKLCEHKCSSKERWCWPGRCGNELASNCICMTGFKTVIESNRSMCQPTIPPKIESCRVTAVAKDGTKYSSSDKSEKCSDQTDFYGRLNIATLEFAINTFINITIEKDIESIRPSLYFKPLENFRISDINLLIDKYPIGQRRQLAKVHTINVPNSTGNSFGIKGMNTTITSPLNNGDRLCVTIQVQAGGILEYETETDSAPRQRHSVPYDKTESNRTLCYVYDIAKPMHCSESNNCEKRPLALSRVTKSRNINLKFEGWFDPIPIGGTANLTSGIESFETSIHEVEPSNGILMRRNDAVGNPKSIVVNGSTSTVDIMLPSKSPMLYAILIEVKDKANNARQARRFVLFDNSSSIFINDRRDFLVTSAVNDTTNGHWQTNHLTLCFSWEGRFFNKDLEPFLFPIREDSYSIHGVYDQVDGLLSTNGTRNINGISAFYYSLDRNNKTVLVGTVDNLESESICLSTTMNDGDIFKLSLQASDITGNKLNDTSEVFIDRSVPEIVDLWLIKDGYEELFVHQSSDLSKINLQFKAFDVHSGLKTVKWAFGVFENKTSYIEKATAVIQVDEEVTCSNSSNCYCPRIGKCSKELYDVKLEKLLHTGSHNRRYFFSIIVTNTAGLIAMEHLDILVDESPPEVGTVFEGPVGYQDIDYTDQESILIHWHGFIDHESGIKLYKVAVARSCLSSVEEFINNNDSNISVYETTSDVLNAVFQDGEGKYFMSIVAFNHAMSPSTVVCSDGITYDRTKPIINNIAIKHSSIEETIACYDNKTWLITENLQKVRLLNAMCTERCLNKTPHEMAAFLQDKSHKEKNDTDVNEFLCGTLPTYSQNIIYTSSDLFEVSWNVSDDRSEIENVYIGFGTDQTDIDAPDIADYSMSHHQNYYFQHHPGLIGEKPVFIFIKAQNKAGLVTKTWIGPVLPDETPPICGSDKLIPHVEGRVIVINWTKSVFFDEEQVDEIDHILFRFGVDDRAVTPFHEWNIRTHGGSCGNGLQCIRFLVRTLQKYDSNDGSLFFAQLHVYNKAGHFCSVDTPRFHLPSMFPPSPGVVVDVLPSDTPTFTDIDVTFNDTIYCFYFSGFGHHERVDMYVGLGNRPKTDNVINFHKINTSTVGVECENMHNVQRGIRYFVTIKASCSGGTTYVSSDGFIILEKSALLNSLQIEHSDRCDVIKTSVSDKSNSTTDITTQEELKPWKAYTLIADYATIIVDMNVILKQILKFGGNNVFVIIPLKSANKIVVKQSLILGEPSEFKLYRCDFHFQHQQSMSSLSLWWSLDDVYRRHVTHYEGGLCKLTNGTSCSNAMFTNLGNVSSHTFYGHFNGKYIGLIKPCFGTVCTEAVVSDKVTTSFPITIPITVHACGKQDDACYSIDVTIHATLSEVSSVRWGIFRANEKRLSEWNYLTNWTENTTLLQDNGCMIVPVYRHTDLHICVEALDKSGHISQNCSVIKSLDDPNMFDKDVVYDLDMSRPFPNSLHQIAHTSNLGDKLIDLHNEEMDFTQPTVRIGGLILGRADQQTSWYIMKKPELPTKPCSLDIDCLLEKNTTGGLLDFENPRLKTSGLLYICVVIQTVQTKHCSDGFLVYRERPKSGIVKIRSNDGFVTGGSVLQLEWSRFSSSSDAIKLGYLSDIANYKYAIGTIAGSDDVLAFTSAGLSTDVTINGLKLINGQVYYTTVRAFDHNGQYTEAYSPGVVFDGSPPTGGMVLVKHSNGYAMSDLILVECEGISDHESGIRLTEVAIGTSQNSADVYPFTQYTGQAEIRQPGLFTDGIKYYAIVKVTNGAGLVTYRMSSPFIVDSTPPSNGHVIEVSSLNTTFDIDYQRDVNAIVVKWFGFTDHHSGIHYYKVGLGTEKGNDDVVRLANVGLKTSKTWDIPLVQGVWYYTSVMACNGAGLCTTRSSNGVVIDNSKPVPGLVVIGDAGKHSGFISSRKRIKVSWVGFQDPQSGISHFEVCFETANGTCNIMGWLNVQISSQIVKSNLNMTNADKILVNVKACNNVGLCSYRSSRYSKIDTSPPENVIKPFIESNIFDKTQSRKILVDPTFFTIKWKFEDRESSLIRAVLSIESKSSTHTSVESLDVGNVESWVFQLEGNRVLRQGDVYIVRVTSCNAASLCTTAVTDELIVDSTPPLPGGLTFPIDFFTNKSSGTMTVALSWNGFLDIESDIKLYYLSIGHLYSDTHVLKDYLVKNATSALLVLNTSDVTQDSLVLSIRAENYAGLSTKFVKVTTSVVSDSLDQGKGQLELQRHSCETYHCDEACKLCECTCAALGSKCANPDRTKCNVLNASFKPILIPKATVILESTTGIVGSSKCLKARWVFHNLSSDTVIRTEYSFGLSGNVIGLGIYNLSRENPWHDAAMLSKATHCLPPPIPLNHDVNYTAYLRVWTSYLQSYTFSSDPVIVDHSPPDIRKRRTVKDVPLSCQADDVDYFVSAQQMTACWENVFHDEQSGIRSYSVALGTFPSWDDIVPFHDVGQSSSIEWIGIKFEPGVRYHTTVRAVNSIGLVTEISSDGFVLDDIVPSVGVMYNSRRHGDNAYHSISTSIEFSWHGFEDEHSFIESYQIAIDFNNSSQGNLIFSNVGLTNHYLVVKDIHHLDVITGYLKAVDKAGHESAVIQSQPLTVDETPPVSFTCVDFESIKNTTIKLVDEKEFRWYKTVGLERHDVLKINTHLSAISFWYKTILDVGQVMMQLPFVVNPDGSVASEYTFMSHEHSVVNVSLHSFGIPVNATIDVKLSRCKHNKIKVNEEYGITAQQISATAVSVCVSVLDPESGIRHIFLSIGSVIDGHEIVSRQPLHHSQHAVVEGNFTHGMTVFIRAEVENHSGMVANFRAQKLLIDHTGPVIDILSSELVHDMNSSIGSVDVQYRVSDPESNVRYCQYCIGPVYNTCSYIPWTMVEGTHSVISAPFNVRNGETIYGTIQCINDVRLMSKAIIGPLTAHIVPPSSDDAKIEFITDSSVDSDFQQDTMSLLLRWDGFGNSEITGYSVHISGHADSVDVGMKDYVGIHKLMLKNNWFYNVSVKATNADGLESSAVQNSLFISDKVPALTGHSIHVKQTTGTSYRISWNGVFKWNADIWYQVSVGSMAGNTDIVMPTTTVGQEIDVDVPPDVKEMFVVITAVPPNGDVTTYRKTVIIF